MKFLSRHLYLLAPLVCAVAGFLAYKGISERKSIVQEYVPPPVEEEVWSEEDYIRHLNLRPFNDHEVHRLLLKRTRQKPGVYLESMSPLMDTIGLEIVNSFHVVMGDDYIPVITSGNDFPGHVRNSKHYRNAAFDFRIKDLSLESRKKLVELVKSRIENRCTVLWEKGEAEHLHVELKDNEIKD